MFNASSSTAWDKRRIFNVKYDEGNKNNKKKSHKHLHNKPTQKVSFFLSCWSRIRPIGIFGFIRNGNFFFSVFWWIWASIKLFWYKIKSAYECHSTPLFNLMMWNDKKSSIRRTIPFDRRFFFCISEEL